MARINDIPLRESVMLDSWFKYSDLKKRENRGDFPALPPFIYFSFDLTTYGLEVNPR